MKTNKHLTLELIQKQRAVRAQDLIEEFGYSGGTARSYLSYLAKQELLHRTGRGYLLTTKGSERLAYFESAGCDHGDCPLCQGKTGRIECPRCGYRLVWSDARILPERKGLFGPKPAGVYCSYCGRQMLTEAQAKRDGIRPTRTRPGDFFSW